MIPKRLILSLALLLFGSGVTAGNVIRPGDKSGDDIRAAATQFLNDLADGKEKQVRAEFAGTGDEAKLLDRLIESVSLGREMVDALKAKFPNDPQLQTLFGPDTNIRDTAAAIPSETIAVHDDGMHASIFATAEDAFGVGLTRVKGKWKVSHPIALQGKDQEKWPAVLDATNSELPSLITRVKKGDFSTSDAAISTTEAAVVSRLRTMATTRPSLKEGLPPDTQPAQQ